MTDKWFLAKIKNTRSIDGLELLGQIISDDKKNGFEYTKNKGLMNEYRTAYGEAKQRLSGAK